MSERKSIGRDLVEFPLAENMLELGNRATPSFSTATLKKNHCCKRMHPLGAYFFRAVLTRSTSLAKSWTTISRTQERQQQKKKLHGIEINPIDNARDTFLQQTALFVLCL